MAEPTTSTARIESATSFRERDAQSPSGKGRERARQKVTPIRLPAEQPEVAAADEQEAHELDTMA